MSVGYPGRGWSPPAVDPGRDHARKSLGGWYGQVAQSLGWRLWDWQQYVFEVALEVDDDGFPARRKIGLIAGRQSGKSALLETLVIGKLYTGHNILITAQERSIARRMWYRHTQRVIAMFRGRRRFEGGGGYLNQRQGEELIVMPPELGGGEYAPFTPNRKSARSRTCDLLIIDEAAYVPLEVLQAAKGTMAARPRFQTWQTSTAGDWRSVSLAQYRRDPEVAMFEWAASGEGCDIADRAEWARALPTYGETGDPDGTGWGVSEAFLADELNSDPVMFAREYLSIWTADPLGSMLTPELWAEIAGDETTVARGDETRIGLDVAPDRSCTAIAAAAPQPDGRIHVEMLDCRRESAGHVVRRLRDIRSRLGERCANRIVIDERSAARPHINILRRAGFRVHETGMADYAAHCGAMCDLAHLRRLRHRPHPDLDAAVASSGTRKLGEAWAWDRWGEDSITPLVAASLAVGEVYRRQRKRPETADEPDEELVGA